MLDVVYATVYAKVADNIFEVFRMADRCHKKRYYICL